MERTLPALLGLAGLTLGALVIMAGSWWGVAVVVAVVVAGMFALGWDDAIRRP